MPKCYIVSDGSYSDYSVYAAFSTFEAAEAFRLLHGYDNRVESIPFDEPGSSLPCVPPGHCAYSVHGGFETRYGDLGLPTHSDWEWKAWRRDSTEPLPTDTNGPHGGTCFCYATDDKHAVKIAHERRMQWVAQQPPGFKQGPAPQTQFSGVFVAITKEMLCKDGLNA